MAAYSIGLLVTSLTLRPGRRARHRADPPGAGLPRPLAWARKGRWSVGDEQLRVLVVEDDVDTAQFVRTVLERRGGMAVTVVHEAMSALAAVDREHFDAVVTDIQMPGMSGLDLLVELRSRAPGVPVLVTTAFASVDYAVEALRRDADEFLVKPVAAATLLERVSTLALQGRQRRAEVRAGDVVLAVGAHPDDVEIGIGGTLASHHANGDTIVIL